MNTTHSALITGASKGFGFSLAEALARQGWRLLINSRNANHLSSAQQQLTKLTEVIAIPGDVQDESHLQDLSEVLKTNHWQLDLVINNASTLGVTPLPHLLTYPVDKIAEVFRTNMIAPVSLLQHIQPYLHPTATLINVSSDAAKEAYEGWGIYGASKAGLDHMTAVLAAENPHYHWYAFDPGDMRTGMHQQAFPGEDISDRPLPGEVAVPALLQLIEHPLPNGRYTTTDILHPQHATHDSLSNHQL
ncbi:MAG: SDR family oxidoreductase [Bacteroidota bacterium]